MSFHHRRPRSKGGSDAPENISKVSSKEHRAWHIMFNNMSPTQIAQKINDVWLDPRFKFVVIQR
jgi:hypothetical protein